VSGSGLPVPGDRLGPYTVERAIGRGTQSVVYRAVDSRTQRPVAIKCMVVHQPHEDPLALEREWQATRQLNHPAIARALAHGQSGAWRWLAQQWVPGHPLDRYARPAWLLPLPIVLSWIDTLAAALEHAHAQGVIHRDIKPANIRAHLVRSEITLLDFGIARAPDAQATRTGVLMATPAYAAPELLQGDHPTPATDLYALGVVFYELLTGRRPHLASDLGQLLRQISQTQPDPPSRYQPSLSDAVDAAVLRLLRRKPAERTPSAQSLRQQLAALLAASPTTARQTP
jgi:serine/threonine-protein kinase